MSRLYLTAMLWHCALFISVAQDAAVFNQVVASTGHVAVQQGLTYSYTVGEVVISTFSANNRTLTQGFHQPEQTQLVYVQEPGLNDWALEVFPNPVSDVLTVRFNSQDGGGLSATVLDLLGKVILSELPLTEEDGSTIDCRLWEAGVYFLVIQHPRSQAIATTRIIRL